MSLSIIQGAVELGLIYAVMSLGIFVSFRVLNIPDLTIDGSFTLGCAVSGIMTVHGYPVLGICLAFIAGAVAGTVTGLLQTKLKVQMILAGILTMTALYSINLHVMDNKPNLSLLNKKTIFSYFENILPESYLQLIVVAVILLLAALLLFLFLKTQLGMSLRATGDNEDMVRASSINADFMKILGLAIANSLVSLSGAVVAQYQSSADINGGIGMMVVGLASIIVGEAIFGRRSVAWDFIAVIAGAVLYRFILTVALRLRMPASDLKLLSAVLVVVAIVIPVIKSEIDKRRARRA